MFAWQTAVRVPATVENLDVPYAAFGQTARVETARRKAAGLPRLFTVKLECRVALAGEIHQLGHGGLHAIGQLVLLDPRENFRISKFLILLLVQRRKCVELGTTILAGNTSWIFQVQHRIALAAQQHALMLGRHEAGSPQAAEQALLREFRTGMHYHVARQVLVHSAQTVAQPGAQARSAGNLAASLDVRDRRVMVDRLGERAVNHREFLGDLGGVRQQFADPQAAVVVFVFGEGVFARADRERFLPRGHPGNALSIANVLRQILAEHFAHLRLVIPKVVMTWSAAHEQVYHPLGLGREVGARRLALGQQIRAEHVGQGRRAQAKRSTSKQLPARHHQVRFSYWIHL